MKGLRLHSGHESKSCHVVAGEFRARTTSRNHSLRLLYYFYHVFLLYSVWLIANLSLARRYCTLLLDAPVVTEELVKGAFSRAIADPLRG